jgi:hypothetical protein
MTREVKRCDCGNLADFEFDDGHRAFCAPCLNRYVREAIGDWGIPPILQSIEDIVRRLTGEQP